MPLDSSDKDNFECNFTLRFFKHSDWMKNVLLKNKPSIILHWNLFIGLGLIDNLHGDNKNREQLT